MTSPNGWPKYTRGENYRARCSTTSLPRTAETMTHQYEIDAPGSHELELIEEPRAKRGSGHRVTRGSQPTPLEPYGAGTVSGLIQSAVTSHFSESGARRRAGNAKDRLRLRERPNQLELPGDRLRVFWDVLGTLLRPYTATRVFDGLIPPSSSSAPSIRLIPPLYRDLHAPAKRPHGAT